ncbi:MAG: DUF4830 domain-containing protein [Acutalibacteraceae bacterium]|nr:DUF4830 domain-containing protein [Acutalibacteraceae bacterium]
MFVVSLTKSKLKKSLLIVLIVVVLSLCFVGVLHFLNNARSIQKGEQISLSASSENEILAFISNYGWQVDTEPVEVRDVIIPETFDEVYNNYNNIQLEQGFDLEKHAGQRVKRWSYVVRNYPETSPEDDFIRINILVSDGVVIGGDVCSVKLDGFMHGFSKE